MKPKPSFKNLPKIQAKKFRKLREQSQRQQATRARKGRDRIRRGIYIGAVAVIHADA